MSGQDSLPSNQCGECAKLHAQIERLQELLGSALKLLDDARPVMDADMTAFRSYGEWRDAEIALMTATYGVARPR